ncbi:hypothetical protein KFK09_016717 [Dendrobium nobile]|uniref:Uncharacterized protein n=1 Tax=Dendrobium nobile TaxID=94219 RepID=A0A8T3B1E6_DENNO|nr:hypothetical protein KFK09_016717 [Dendrobium nobile]
MMQKEQSKNNKQSSQNGLHGVFLLKSANEMGHRALQSFINGLLHIYFFKLNRLSFNPFKSVEVSTKFKFNTNLSLKRSFRIGLRFSKQLSSKKKTFF